jgi:hypothetical protein
MSDFYGGSNNGFLIFNLCWYVLEIVLDNKHHNSIQFWMLLIFFFLFWWSVGDWTQGLIYARQELYHLSCPKLIHFCFAFEAGLVSNLQSSYILLLNDKDYRCVLPHPALEFYNAKALWLFFFNFACIFLSTADSSNSNGLEAISSLFVSYFLSLSFLPYLFTYMWRDSCHISNISSAYIVLYIYLFYSIWLIFTL